MAAAGRDLQGSPDPTPCSSRDTQSQLPRTMPRQILNSSKNGDSITSLDNPHPTQGLSSVLALTQSRAELAPYLLQFAFFVSLLVFDDLREVLGTIQGNFFS